MAAFPAHATNQMSRVPMPCANAHELWLLKRDFQYVVFSMERSYLHYHCTSIMLTPPTLAIFFFWVIVVTLKITQATSVMRVAASDDCAWQPSGVSQHFFFQRFSAIACTAAETRKKKKREIWTARIRHAICAQFTICRRMALRKRYF